MSAADPLVIVCRDPRDPQRARVRLSALDGFDFDAFSHGLRSTFPRPMIVATMALADVVDGELRHPASHGTPPDRVKVAITRTHNASIYPILERIAAAKRMGELAPVPRVRTRLNPPSIPQ